MTRVGRALSFRRVSALYVFIFIFAVFAIWVPGTFLTDVTLRSLLTTNALTALVAIGLVLPLAAGVYDLSVGAAMGAGGIFAAWMLSKKGMPVVPSILGAVAVGAAIGLINGLIVVKARVDSFIATLGMSSALAAFVLWVSGGVQLIGLSSSFQSIANTKVFTVSLPVYMMLAVAIIVWYVLERTPVGRRIYATGGSPEAARLAGVNTGAVIIVTLVCCSTIACFAGVLLTASVASGDPTSGPNYLLPAFSAAFLGATQFRAGRFNVWGTIVAVYVLATGVKGLQLAGAPVWLPPLFNGVALVVAVALAKSQRVKKAQDSGKASRGWLKARFARGEA